MSEHEKPAGPVNAALRRAVAAAPDDFDHPGYVALEAFVDGTLPPADREAIQTHIDLCAQCAEDVSDLSGMRDAATVKAPAVADVRWIRPAIAVAAVAAIILITILISRRPEPAAATTIVATTPAPTPAVVAPVDPLTSEERAIVDRVTASGRLERPARMSDLAEVTGTLLGAPTTAALTPISPVATAVLSARPTLSWSPVAGARGYTVAIFNDRFAEVARSERINVTTWTVTSDLPRDRTLAWQVTAHLDGSDVVGPTPPQPEARFTVLDAATATAASESATRLAERPLALGILLARNGLMADATVQLQRAAADPATAASARRLLADLKPR